MRSLKGPCCWSWPCHGGTAINYKPTWRTGSLQSTRAYLTSLISWKSKTLKENIPPWISINPQTKRKKQQQKQGERFQKSCEQLGGGNSNIFGIFTPVTWGSVSPILTARIFFKWVGSTAKQKTTTTKTREKFPESCEKENRKVPIRSELFFVKWLGFTTHFRKRKSWCRRPWKIG